MLNVESSHSSNILPSALLHVTGYADGSDWLLRHPGFGLDHCGIANEHFVWLLDTKSRLFIIDALSRQTIGSIDVGAGGAYCSYKVTVSRDKQKLLVLCLPPSNRDEVRQDNRRLLVVEVATARVHRIFENLGCRDYRNEVAPVEAADGRLLLLASLNDKDSMMVLDPTTGERSIEELPQSRGYRSAWHSPSPRGKYWLRHDPACLPITDTGGILGRLLPNVWPRQRYYGLSVQLWQARPMRFVRRITLAWFTAVELPAETASTGDNLNASYARRASVFDTISGVLGSPPSDPLEVPTRLAFPPEIAGNDTAW